MTLTLIVRNGPFKGRVYDLQADQPEVIGRQAPRLCLPDSQISRRHAEIRCENDTWIIRDLGSTNGTYVNGRRLTGLTELEEDDEIVIGRILLRVEHIATPASPDETSILPPAFDPTKADRDRSASSSASGSGTGTGSKSGSGSSVGLSPLARPETALPGPDLIRLHDDEPVSKPSARKAASASGDSARSGSRDRPTPMPAAAADNDDDAPLTLDDDADVADLAADDSGTPGTPDTPDDVPETPAIPASSAADESASDEDQAPVAEQGYLAAHADLLDLAGFAGDEDEDDDFDAILSGPSAYIDGGSPQVAPQPEQDDKQAQTQEPTQTDEPLELAAVDDEDVKPADDANAGGAGDAISLAADEPPVPVADGTGDVEDRSEDDGSGAGDALFLAADDASDEASLAADAGAGPGDALDAVIDDILAHVDEEGDDPGDSDIITAELVETPEPTDAAIADDPSGLADNLPDEQAIPHQPAPEQGGESSGDEQALAVQGDQEPVHDEPAADEQTVAEQTVAEQGVNLTDVIDPLPSTDDEPSSIITDAVQTQRPDEPRPRVADSPAVADQPDPTTAQSPSETIAPQPPEPVELAPTPQPEAADGRADLPADASTEASTEAYAESSDPMPRDTPPDMPRHKPRRRRVLAALLSMLALAGGVTGITYAMQQGHLEWPSQLPWPSIPSVGGRTGHVTAPQPAPDRWSRQTPPGLADATEAPAPDQGLATDAAAVSGIPRPIIEEALPRTARGGPGQPPSADALADAPRLLGGMVLNDRLLRPRQQAIPSAAAPAANQGSNQAADPPPTAPAASPADVAVTSPADNPATESPGTVAAPAATDTISDPADDPAAAADASLAAIQSAAADPRPTPAAAEPMPHRIAYLVDASGSLLDSLDDVVDWLGTRIDRLDPATHFTILFFRQGQAVEVPPLGLRPATDQAKEQVQQWIAPSQGNILPSGRSNPLTTLERAIAYGVDEIVLISDDSFSRTTADARDQTLQRFEELVTENDVVVHTVQFFYPDPRDILRSLAHRHGGTFRFIQPPKPVGPDPLGMLHNFSAAPSSRSQQSQQ